LCGYAEGIFHREGGTYALEQPTLSTKVANYSAVEVLGRQKVSDRGLVDPVSRDMIFGIIFLGTCYIHTTAAPETSFESPPQVALKNPP